MWPTTTRNVSERRAEMLDAALSDRAMRVMLLVLTLVTAIAGLRYAEAIVAPFVLALVLGIVVSPLSEKLTAWGLPRVISTAAMLVLTCAVVFFFFLLLEPLLSLLIERLPRLKAAVDGWINWLSDVLQGIETLSNEIEETVGSEGGERATKVPTIGDALWLAPNFGAQVFIFVGTFFFFLLTRDDIYAAAGPWKERLFRADAIVSRYFAAVTLVNVGVGLATGAVMMAIGVDYALLWGLAAAAMNYILYLGPLMIIVGLAVAGLVQFWGAMAFLPPLAFTIINIAEANFVTPLVVGQHVQANPLVVFLAVVFGLWLWGPIGAVVALPVILWLGLMLQPVEDGVVSRATTTQLPLPK